MKLKQFFFILLSFVVFDVQAQFNPAFFPNFVANPANPIINYGDGFADATWNDPCVLKENGQYIMYLTSAVGIVLSSTNTVKVYRKVSSDGINWTLSPTTPVMEPALGTYYAGGTETPSVVKKDSIYHMYLTCYPPGNNPAEFVIAHATSNDGITWNMDATPIIESDGSNSIYGDLVGEPGAVVYNDSIHLFFTAAGTVNAQAVQCIGLMKSADGANFTSPQIAVQLPQDVYPLTDNYWGLSTPSALAINDTIYLFTDVARTINGVWTQVALHQFKTLANSGVWYHDTLSIHTMQDFTWTDGDYLSSLLAPTLLLDDNGVLRIWYAGYRLADVNGVDTTYNVYFDSLGIMHINPDFWGIGTSTYQFPLVTKMNDIYNDEFKLNYFPNPAKEKVYMRFNKMIQDGKMTFYDLAGRIVKSQSIQATNNLCIDVSVLQTGIYFLEIQEGEMRFFERLVIEK
jgi:predicted GH43/DUF377 family glycosyl hydrolase